MIVRTPQLWKGVRTSQRGPFASLPAPTQHLPGVSISSPFCARLLPGPARRDTVAFIHCVAAWSMQACYSLSTASERCDLITGRKMKSSPFSSPDSWICSQQQGPKASSLILWKFTSNRDDPDSMRKGYNNLGMHHIWSWLAAVTFLVLFCP